MGLVTIANNKKEGGLPVHDAHHKCAFLNHKTESDDGSEVKINLLIVPQAYDAHERRNYNCMKANHATKIISKKRLKKNNDGLVVKINQRFEMQAHHFGKKKDYEIAKTDNATPIIQEHGLEPYSRLVETISKKREVLTVDDW